MATVAEQLRRAREEQKLTVYQAAETTKIKTEHIRALEAGDYNAFSAPVYIRGFVRTYAKYLRLDPMAISADLDEELGQTKRFRAPPPLTDQPRTALDWVLLQFARFNSRWVLAGAAILVFAVVTTVIVRSQASRLRSDPLEKLSPGLYEETQQVTGEMLPLPPSQPPRR